MAIKPLKVLVGERIIIENFTTEDIPVEEKNSGIILTPDAQKELDAEKSTGELATTERFKILQVGTGVVNDCWKEGQEIYIEKPMRTLAPENVESIVENGKILGFIIPERMIAGIY
jgi:co-chaperonin GroES (HSP10)